MLIVIDSNIWMEELGLTTAMGAAFQFYVKQKSAKIVLPEVIKREVEFNLKKSLSKHCDDIGKSHRQLLSVFRSLKQVVLPSEADIHNCVASLFDNVDVPIVNIPFSLKSANHSFEKVLAGQAPSSPKNQQFKDGVIWADCIALLEEDEVFLISKDKGFYRNGDYNQGLAENLENESKSCQHDIHLFQTLTDVLQKIQEPFEIDESSLVDSYLSVASSSVDALVLRNEFRVSKDPTVDISMYITENPDQVFIDFKLLFPCEDESDDGRTSARVELKGDGMYHLSLQNFSDFRTLEEKLCYIDDEGEQQKANHHLYAQGIIIGHSSIEHVIRHKIELSE